MLAAAPVLAPFLGGVLLLLPRSGALRRAVSLGVLALQAGLAGWLLTSAFTSGPVVAMLGGWREPAGIVLVADKTAAILVALAVLVGLAATLSSLAERPAEQDPPARAPLVQFLLTGIQLSFLTGDLFNLFVAFEVMLLASYSLLTLEAERGQVRGAYPYVILNLVGSALFLAACGYAYALFGSLNFAVMAQAAAALAQSTDGALRVAVLAALLAFVFSLKAGMFPLYYWLPNSYPLLPPSLGALYSGLLTKVGIYALLRLLGTVMPPTQGELYTLIAWLGGGTMLFGVLGAISRGSVRQVLAFHVLSQVGFMILAIGFATPLAYAATIFYVVHHIVVKSALFVAAGGVLAHHGTDELSRTGGLWRARPLFGLAFLLLALSLAGLPPLSGFWAKLWILMEGLAGGWYTLVGVSLLASVLTLASMLKIWLAAFWRPAPEGAPPPGRPGAGLWLALGGLLAVSLLVVVGVQPLWMAARSAAVELSDPAGYVESVLRALEGP